MVDQEMEYLWLPIPEILSTFICGNWEPATSQKEVK